MDENKDDVDEITKDDEDLSSKWYFVRRLVT